MLFFDYPTDTGFSIATNKHLDVAEQIDQFLRGIDKIHPQIFKRGIVLAGSSYAAKVIAQMGVALKDKFKIKAILVQNPIIDPL